MNDIQDKLDKIFIDQLEYEYEPHELLVPDIDGSENILNYSREYTAHDINIIVVICKDRRVEFQKEFIKKEKNILPNSYFLFVSNEGKVFDLYNDATAKNKRKITYDQVSLKTALFKEKIQLFNVSKVGNGTELQINAEKAFDTNDKVAKSFFDKFQKIHKKLQSAITGIDNPKDLSWYASVLMNRFMFIYFLQKHNVIQDNPNFLLDKFGEVEKLKKDYYHDFLLPLFFYGFARKDTNLAKQEFIKVYGNVRYLNGGLFYPHQVEKKYTPSKVIIKPHEEKSIHTTIQVDAKKIKEVLVFLNGYTWYLDQRPMEDENQINPDVLGYIFEKYINQKELGAYYTKEDITEYISKNTIIPFILDKMRGQGYSSPEPNPLITNNEDIIGTMHKYVESIDDYEEVKFLYSEVLQPLSVLDPSVGSGAFLFAALNILLPIYQKVVHRLRHFSKEKDDAWLHEHLKLIDKHSEEYFLTKQIILNNLYGVDIVEEATEICKLRLFLQLVSHISDIKLIEPLPDIDFNIYAGNSLVGGTSWDDLVSNYTMDLFVSQNRDQIKDDIEQLSGMKREFRRLQQQDDNEEILSDLKNNILTFNNRINKDLRLTIDNPFHWFVDFHSIMKKGGFDVIIGNPPYVEYSTVKKDYELKGYETVKCGNIYANFIERASKILTLKDSRLGLIIPISFSSTKRMRAVQEYLLKRSDNTWISSYAERPSKLFEGAEVSLNIILSNMNKEATNSDIYTTKYNKWSSDERLNLFSNLQYINSTNIRNNYSIPKIGSDLERNILSRISEMPKTSAEYFSEQSTSYMLNYKNAGGRYYKIFLPFTPEFSINGEEKDSSTNKKIFFQTEEVRDAFCALFNSTLFFVYWTIYSDTWHLVANELSTIRVPDDEKLISLAKLGKKLTTSLMENSSPSLTEKRNKGRDTVVYKKYFGRYSKSIIDEIDSHLGKLYNFSNTEIDFIINFDIDLRVDE